MEKYYDIKEGIQNSLVNLETFHKLVKERHDAHYLRKESLDYFIILGKYIFDTCGNLGLITEVEYEKNKTSS